MSKMKNIKKAHETAEARMAIIAPLLAPGLDKDTVRKLRETIAETNQVSQRSLDRYLRAYHNEGFNGLLPTYSGVIAALSRKNSRTVTEF